MILSEASSKADVKHLTLQRFGASVDGAVLESLICCWLPCRRLFEKSIKRTRRDERGFAAIEPQEHSPVAKFAVIFTQIVQVDDQTALFCLYHLLNRLLVVHRHLLQGGRKDASQNALIEVERAMQRERYILWR